MFLKPLAESYPLVASASFGIGIYIRLVTDNSVISLSDSPSISEVTKSGKHYSVSFYQTKVEPVSIPEMLERVFRQEFSDCQF